MSCNPPENVPVGAGIWFSRFKDMLSHYEASPHKDELFCVSWDRLNATTLGSKMFGVFATPSHYFETIRLMPSGTVCGYELILENTRCKLYFDVEWDSSGTADPMAAEILKKICHTVVLQCKTRLSTSVPSTSRTCGNWKDLKLDFYMSTCSRLKNPETFKNSFHLVVHNVIFPNNHDGMMKDFAVQLGFPDYIDKAVYTRNRCIRTELSAKSGQAHCFTNVSILPPGHSAQDREQQLLSSLITRFDSTLPTVCYKNAKEALALSANAVKRKRTCDIISADTSGTMANPANALPIASDFNVFGAYFGHIFNDNIQTKITTRKIRATDPLPPSAKLLLEDKIITADAISFIYIEKPKWCISQLMNAVKHRHRSNNACAVAIVVGGKTEVYARCYCCKSPAYSKLAIFDEKTKTLPSLHTNDAFRRILHSPYGIHNVKDSADRERVIKLFQQTEGSVKEKLKSVRSLRYFWSKYVQSPASGWFFIPEPCSSVSLENDCHESASENTDAVDNT